MRLAFVCLLQLTLCSYALAQGIVTDCDKYAASDADPNATAPGVPLERVDAAHAVPACTAAVREFPDNPRVLFQLGRAYRAADNSKLALEYYRRAAEQNYAPAENSLGRAYAVGLGVPRDDQQAVAWYRKAADQGLAAAQNNLGVMYSTGQGVPEDPLQAAAWYRKAADQGFAAAQSNFDALFPAPAGVMPMQVLPSMSTGIAGKAIMAIVSLRSQRITVYDANGPILQAPVSSGQQGRETPAGIFSIIQKEAEHYSNLYDDAYMPHMQRITWSGIALHGGTLPGHPASHGCVRMPYEFAEHLFDVTRLGMRVIVAPSDVAPAAIAHPALFPAKPGVRAFAAARTAEADAAASKADQARLAVATASREAARATMPVRAAENLTRRVKAQLAADERAVASAGSAEEKAQAEAAKANAAARVAELEAQFAAATAELQPKLDALTHAREAALAAETARVDAAEAARKAARDLEPVSVFISRKTQRLYVRQAFQPILEIPVTIQDADRPIGTHVFTAMEPAGDNGDMRWSVVSLNGRHPIGDVAQPRGPAGRRSSGDAAVSGPSDAKAALDRIAIPQETFDHIAEMVSPRSSLIISDEVLSPETGDGTEFVILMSGEPQGGIKGRWRGQESHVR